MTINCDCFRIGSLRRKRFRLVSEQKDRGTGFSALAAREIFFLGHFDSRSSFFAPS